MTLPKPRNLVIATLSVTVALAMPSPSRAQTQGAAAAPLSFEVASIKPAAPGESGMMSRMTTSPGGRFTVEGYTVKALIQQAYDVKDFQITGGPGWVNSERYDIIAKAETSAKPEQIKLMLQSLLAERFKLVIHRDTKELPVYALVVAKNGPKLHQADPETQAAKGGGWGVGGGRITGRSLPVSTFAKLLSEQLERTVVDRTGLTGIFDFKLEWTPDRAAAGLSPDSPSVPAELGPSLFTALQEQLGLKLESTKGPVEVLVIDRVEKPSGN